ncbi:hypothetical protein [Absidia glauca]|uniref:Uncharacterized protein n=1 Tax=Absidia glauca TaxID=4829 RepID=A0A168M6U7_ABSGL|nr:hypothetical protein [Absidia glauca]
MATDIGSLAPRLDGHVHSLLVDCVALALLNITTRLPTLLFRYHLHFLRRWPTLSSDSLGHETRLVILNPVHRYSFAYPPLPTTTTTTTSPPEFS